MNKTGMRDQAPSVTQGLPGATRPSSGMSEKAQKSALTGGSVVGALAVSSCCILPLALFSLGITGAWIGGLTALYPYKWYFCVPAAAFIATGFYKVYRKPEASACAAESACASPISDRVSKIALWSSAALVLAALAFPYAAPALLGVE